MTVDNERALRDYRCQARNLLNQLSFNFHEGRSFDGKEILLCRMARGGI
jgi:hypothetical protein